jgi:hypothetical protein
MHRVGIHASALQFFALGATDPHLFGEVILEVTAVHDGQGYWIPHFRLSSVTTM